MMTETIKAGFLKLLSYWALFLKKLHEMALTLFSVGVCLAILIGWRLSRHELITPKHGFGYMLGPLGVILIVIVMIYPLRKRMRTWGQIWPIKRWFQVHMFLGVVGPLLILFHSNFHLGALNSNVALFSVLIVSGSGIIGKYFYGRIHRSLYGERTCLVELLDAFKQQKEGAEPQFALIPGVNEVLNGFAANVITPTKVLMHSIRRLCVVRWEAQNVRWKVRSAINTYLEEHARKHQWSHHRKRDMQVQMRRKTEAFLYQALKVAEFNLYERVFNLWHMFHLPLVSILSFAALFHVLAVNRY